MHFRPVPRLTQELWFPPVSQANSEGLVAIGGDLHPERLILAYKSGIFPWFSGQIPHWYSLDPRFVLRPSELKISKSMRPIINQKKFELRINTSFREVIKNCKTIQRDGQSGTWITNDIVKSYTQLHEMGIAHCAESWQDGELVGGLYGIKMGKVFLERACSANNRTPANSHLYNMCNSCKAKALNLSIVRWKQNTWLVWGLRLLRATFLCRRSKD